MVYEDGKWLQEEADDMAISHIFDKVSIELLPIVRLYQSQKLERISDPEDIIALITEIVSDKLNGLQETSLYQNIVCYPDSWQYTNMT
jgi:hypothetical protein